MKKWFKKHQEELLTYGAVIGIGAIAVAGICAAAKFNAEAESILLAQQEHELSMLKQGFNIAELGAKHPREWREWFPESYFKFHPVEALENVLEHRFSSNCLDVDIMDINPDTGYGCMQLYTDGAHMMEDISNLKDCIEDAEFPFPKGIDDEITVTLEW